MAPEAGVVLMMTMMMMTVGFSLGVNINIDGFLP